MQADWQQCLLVHTNRQGPAPGSHMPLARQPSVPGAPAPVAACVWREATDRVGNPSRTATF